MSNPVEFSSGGREGIIVTVIKADGRQNVFVPTEIAYENGEPAWKDVYIDSAGFTAKAHSLDTPPDLVPADDDTKADLVLYFEDESARIAKRPDFTSYKLHYPSSLVRR